jgi:hydrogenase nickel incorporation protein HypB
MFRAADLSLITKTDLLAYITEFKVERAHAALRQIGFGGETIELTNRGGAGFAAWLAWLEREVAAQRERTARGTTSRPAIQPEGAAAHAAGRPPR